MNVSFAPEVDRPLLEERRGSSWKMQRNVANKKHCISFHDEDVIIGKLYTGLDLLCLEDFLCRTIPELTGDWRAHRMFQGLASLLFNKDKVHTSTFTGWDGEPKLLQVADWLQTFLDSPSSKCLEAIYLAQVHSFIGLIRMGNNEHESAQRAYVSAAWIMAQQGSVDDSIIRDQLSVSLYRLGALYGKTGQQRRMRETVARAFAVHNKSSSVRG